MARRTSEPHWKSPKGSLGVVLFWVGCAPSASPQQEPVSSPAPAASVARENPNPAPSVELPPVAASAASATSPERRVVHHEYREVFGDFGALVFDRGRPLLFASQGAVDLSSGTILFERDSSNAVVFRGDSVWYADGFSPMSACPERSVLVQLFRDKWVPRYELNVHAIHVRPWFAGSSLAAVVPKRAGPPWGYELMVLERNRAAPTPERAGRTREADCHTRIADLEALLTFPSGEIFAFGRECPLLARDAENEHGGTAEADATVTLAVESWASGSKKSTFASLPFTELSSVAGIDADDIWATGALPEGKFALAHFDGRAWTVAPPRFGEPLTSLVIPKGDSGPQARRYFLSGRGLFELRGDALREHALPTDCDPSALEIDGERLWPSCSRDSEMSLFTTDPNVAPFSFPENAWERPLVRWREQSLPALDPKGPRGRCGPASEHSGSSKVRHKPGPSRPSLPGPSKLRHETRPFELGY